MGTEERQRLIRGGALTTDYSQLGLEGVGQEFVTGTGMENIIRGIQTEGIGGLTNITGTTTAAGVAFGAVGSAAAGAFEAMGVGGGMSQKAAALRRLGIGERGGGGPLEMGGGYTTSRAGITRGVQMAAMRAGGATREAFKFAKDDKDIADMKLRLNAAYGKSERLRKLKKENPRGYGAALLTEMGYDVTAENLNRLAVVQQEENVGGGSLAVDFKQEASEIVGFPETFSELAGAQTSTIEEMYQLAGGRNLAEGMMAGAEAGAAVGLFAGGLGALPGAITGGAAGLIEAAVSDTGVEREDIERAMTGPGSDIVHRFLKGELTRGEAVKRLQNVRGSEGIESLLEKIDTGVIDIDKMRGLAKKFTTFRKVQAAIEGRGRIQEMAEATRKDVTLKGPGAEERAGAFSDLVRAYEGKGGAKPVLEAAELAAAQVQAQEFAKSLTRGQAEELAKAGAVGRQASALFEVSEAAKGKMAGVGQSREMLQRLESMGFGLEQIKGAEGKRLRELAKGGIKKDEAEEFGKLASDAFKNMFSELVESRETHNEKMTRLLNVYTEANTKFVGAVARAIGDEDLQASYEEMSSKESKKLAPATEGGG
jgi:hypothetical protein